MIQNLGEHIGDINSDFVNSVYAKFMTEQWGISVGYQVPDLYSSVMNKQLADWQLLSDCNGELCKRSSLGTTTITKYPTWGNSPFPQIVEPYSCESIAASVSGGAPAVPEIVNVVVPPLSIQQYEVGAINGPIPGYTTFTPLNTLGNPVLMNKNIDIALGAFLELSVDYDFSIITGTITLRLGRLFNVGEVYTIISY